MTPHFALKVAAAQQRQADTRDAEIEKQARLICALVDANAERDAALKLYAHEIARLAEDNALMVEAVTQYPLWTERRMAPNRVH